ncbi:MAG TPA: hypothetical protein VFO38_03815 [Candidatus Saccharimonadales bacterium]|nr:hypothetical protein [Candidatus Saccharimonadales bacterium]
MDGLRSKLVAFAKGFVFPIRTDQLEPLPAIQWTWWRKVLFVVMLAAAGWFLWRILFPSISWLLYIVQHDGPVVLTETPRQEEMMSWLTNWGLIIASALVVLACMGAIGGKQATGLFRPARMHAAAFGYFVRTVYPFSVLAALLYLVMVRAFPQLQGFAATSGKIDTAVEYAYLNSIMQALASGIAEEIVATVLVYWLLNHVPGPKGKTLAESGWGTAIIIVVHLSYHTYYGVGLVMVIPSVYFSVICWRRMRSLPAIVAGHVLWDLILLAPRWSVGVLFAVVMYIGFRLDSEPRRTKQVQTA